MITVYSVVSFAMVSIHSLRLFSLILLSFRIAASPASVADLPTAVFTLPVQKVVNSSGHADFVQAGRVRLQSFQTDARRPFPDNATNQVVTYTVALRAGSGSYSKLVVDTGSSNTWVGSDPGNRFKPSKSSNRPYGFVGIVYGSGLMFGVEYLDTVELTPALNIKGQSIGAGYFTIGFQGFDGILGLGPVGLTQSTVTNFSAPFSDNQTVPTVMNNLKAQEKISNNILGVYFAPATNESTNNGELSFGGVDFSQTIPFGISGVFPRTTPYWGISGLDMKYQNATIGSSQTCIVDTGTTLIYLPKSTFQAYKNATGAETDPSTNLLSITLIQYQNLVDLIVNIGGKQFYLTPNGQIFPRSLNTAIGGDPNKIYLIIASGGIDGGGQIPACILGQSWLERWYSVYDTDSDMVGFIQTDVTNATTN
ncbi:hypothetical protein GYMLUDRAFT_733420 [Collybiopsis luxurians FD-317 M1]|nr:hypothetical protein GYMLUDRAFT_733420 [Collybiopsis luxurians FD-317 M1]